MPNDLQIYLDGALAPGGDGTSWGTAYGAGEWAAAFADFSSGVNNTLNVRNYTHTSPVVMPAGSSGNPNTLQGFNGTAVINGAAYGIDFGADYTRIFDFQISNCTGNAVAGNSGLNNQREVKGCSIFGNSGYGIAGFSGLKCTVCEDNEIYNNGNTGIWMFSNTDQIYKGINSYGNTGEGYEIRIDTANTCVFEDCTASENSANGFKLNYDVIDLRGTIESKENQDYGIRVEGINSITNTGRPLMHRNFDGGLYIRNFTGAPQTVTINQWIFTDSIGILSENWFASIVNVTRCTFSGCWTAYRPAFNLTSGTINFIDCIFAFGLYVVDGRNYSYGGTISYSLLDALLIQEIINGALFSLGAGMVTGDALFAAPSWQGAAPDWSPLDFRISDTGDAVGMSSTSGDVGAFDSESLTGPTTAPEITGVPNADNVSVDITLASMPADSSSVLLYQRTDTGFDNLVHTFTGTGSWNDDNGGAGYGKYRVLHYIAVAVGSPAGPPSQQLQVQVGTDRRLTMGALINQTDTLIANDPTMLTLGYLPKKYFVDPKPVTSQIYILPGQERPDVRYANKLVESEMDVELQVTTTSGVGRTAWATNEDAVNRMIDLLHLQELPTEKWGCLAYRTVINSVDRNDDAEGDQPQNPLTTISFTVTTQYAKFIP
jgi:hypothetical protein